MTESFEKIVNDLNEETPEGQAFRNIMDCIRHGDAPMANVWALVAVLHKLERIAALLDHYVMLWEGK